MAKQIQIQPKVTLDDYAAVAHLAPAVADLQVEARRVASALAGRTVWMVNSTGVGGGVAEMIPKVVTLLRDLGIAAEWVVIESEEEEFFRVTKHIHNLIHGAGEPTLTAAQRELYEAVNRRNAAYLRSIMKPGDVLIVHDPQPMPLANLLTDEMDLLSVWRCHIGLDEENGATRTAWEFLEPYGRGYDRAVFSAPEYIPAFLTGRASVIYPAIDPLASKNRDLHLHKLVGTLANAALAVSPGPAIRPPFPRLAMRLQHGGGYAPATLPDDIGLLIRPVITQVSRWDRLKGWLPLMEAFVELKRRAARRAGGDNPRAFRCLSLVRLVLAGPDPRSIEDDPEGLEVLRELEETYVRLHPEIKNDIALVTLPMEEPRQNALMVNALQRASTLVVQNSLREGFGLTVTEAMWKRIPVLSNSRACGPRHQIRDGVDGRLIPDPEDRQTLATAMEEMLLDADARELWGRSAQRHAHDNFLIFRQVQDWLQLLEDML